METPVKIIALKGACLWAFVLMLSLAATTAGAAGIPDYMDIITGEGAPQSKAQVANRNVIELNNAMFGIYADALQNFQKTLLAHHPVILALFATEGGQMTLYRPGQAPLKAPSPPVRYQLLKSVGHSTLAVFELGGSHLRNLSDGSWRGSMLSYRTANQTALSTLDASDLTSEMRENIARILKRNIAFMDQCLKQGNWTFADLQKFAHDQREDVHRNIWWAADTQVSHWMTVVKGWKEMLGPDWQNTYALSNTLYVTRQNNILFSVLAQFFGKDAINTRLFLFETPAFTTTSEEMLSLLARTVADRSVGLVFFGNYYLMDYELMGGDARTAIAENDKKMGMPVFLPPLVPFHSTEWPFRIDPNQGKGPATIDQIKQQ
jgi:hypothetical protein